MSVNRRGFLKLTAGAAGAACAASEVFAAPAPKAQAAGPLAALKPMTAGIVPISDDERRGRIEKARRLMIENKIDAICLEGGSSLFYYTAVNWRNSERAFVWILPARGEDAWVCPKFEEDRTREQTRPGTEVRTWEEDEDPAAVVAGIFKSRGIRTGKVGMEEQVRFLIFDGIRRTAPALELVSATPVTAGCRIYKSPAEIALMQKANDITVAAYKAAIAMIREGMTKADFSADAAAAFAACGVVGNIGASFGEQSALPHGSIKPRKLRPGDIVLMDGGCAIEGYRSDVSRTIVFGKPSKKQLDVWNLEQKAQAAAFQAAKLGVPCEAVDAAARKVITDAGYGPDYKVPGLPHRTGHGIGLDGHEWTNLVRGNKTPLQPGMCFTDEPMIVIPGEFGVRLEDDFYMTAAGAKFFTKPSLSIDKPFE